MIFKICKMILTVFSWTKENNMNFNTNKFELMRYIVRNTQIDFEYKTRESLIFDEYDNIVDNEVIISDTTKFYDQNMKQAEYGRGRA